MTTEIAVALVAACASAVVALVSLIGTILGNRQNAVMAKQLEEFRHYLSSKEAVAEADRDREMSARRTWLSTLRGLQNFRDQLLVVSSTFPGSMSATAAIESISSARKRVFEAYAEAQAEINEETRLVMHRAKNLCLSGEMIVSGAAKSGTDVFLVDVKTKGDLDDLRSRLGELLSELRIADEVGSLEAQAHPRKILP